jgi:hypothetical protein
LLLLRGRLGIGMTAQAHDAITPITAGPPARPAPEPPPVQLPVPRHEPEPWPGPPPADDLDDFFRPGAAR